MTNWDVGNMEAWKVIHYIASEGGVDEKVSRWREWKTGNNIEEHLWG